MSFFELPPSVDWEPRSLLGDPSLVFWVWIKPAAEPSGALIHWPAALFESPATPVTIRSACVAAGIDPGQLASFHSDGHDVDAAFGMSPWLDHPLAPQPPETDVTVMVRCHVAPRLVHYWQPQVSPPASYWPPEVAAWSVPIAASVPNIEGSSHSTQPLPAPLPPDHATGEFLQAVASMESDWIAVQQFETQLRAARNQLEQAQGRLSGLNRELNGDEARFADSKDKKDWQEARRWLRDAAAQAGRFVKEIDIGGASAAGKRNWFAAIFERYVATRSPFDQWPRIRTEFESHRRYAQHLLAQAQSALQKSSRDGEQRANQVLQRIAAKVRSQGRR